MKSYFNKRAATGLFVGISTITGYSLSQQAPVSADGSKAKMFEWGQGIKGQLGLGLQQYGVQAPKPIENLEN